MNTVYEPVTGVYPKKLNIINPQAKDLGTALGIDRVRQAEIGCEIFWMVKKFQGQCVRSCEVLNQIAGFCNSEEETLWAALLHSSQLARGGFIL